MTIVVDVSVAGRMSGVGGSEGENDGEEGLTKG